MAYPVSKRFLSAIPRPHQVATVVTITPPGGSATVLKLSSGSVTTDRTQRTRRVATLAVKGGSDLFEQISTPATRIAIDHGIQWGGADRELVPMIRGEVSTGSLTLGDGLIQFGVADLWQGIASADYLAPFTPAITATRAATILTAIEDVYPGIVVINTASDTGTIATAQAWTSRADMVTSLANDGGMDAFFGPDGTFVLRDLPQITDPVAWLIKTGPGGTLETLQRTRALDKLWNAVILTPATSDPSQAWDQVTAVITDPANPRYPGTVGRTIPYRYAAPTLLTEDEAIAVAEQLLIKVQGSTETLSFGAISNPALEGGDIVRVLTPIDGGNTIVNHFLDSVATDLLTGSMTGQSRASQELAA